MRSDLKNEVIACYYNSKDHTNLNNEKLNSEK